MLIVAKFRIYWFCISKVINKNANFSRSYPHLPYSPQILGIDYRESRVGNEKIDPF